MKKKPLIVALFILAIILCVRGRFAISKIDRSGPDITFPDTKITYKQGDPYTTLLSDVKAIDRKDGDVSDALIVEKVDADPEAKEAVVTYAAIDRKCNLSKAVRMVAYEPKKKEDPKATAKANEKPQEQPENSPEASPNKDSKELEDPKDSGKPKASEQPISASPNVLGTAPILYLKTDRISIEENDKFTVRNFVSHIVDDNDREDILIDNIKRVGNYNVAKKGTYELVIYVVDSVGNESNREKVTLTVN